MGGCQRVYVSRRYLQCANLPHQAILGFKGRSGTACGSRLLFASNLLILEVGAIGEMEEAIFVLCELFGEGAFEGEGVIAGGLLAACDVLQFGDGCLQFDGSFAIRSVVRSSARRLSGSRWFVTWARPLSAPGGFTPLFRPVQCRSLGFLDCTGRPGSTLGLAGSFRTGHQLALPGRKRSSHKDAQKAAKN